MYTRYWFHVFVVITCPTFIGQIYIGIKKFTMLYIISREIKQTILGELTRKRRKTTFYISQCTTIQLADRSGSTQLNILSQINVEEEAREWHELSNRIRVRSWEFASWTHNLFRDLFYIAELAALAQNLSLCLHYFILEGEEQDLLFIALWLRRNKWQLYGPKRGKQKINGNYSV